MASRGWPANYSSIYTCIYVVCWYLSLDSVHICRGPSHRQATGSPLMGMYRARYEYICMEWLTIEQLYASPKLVNSECDHKYILYNNKSYK